MSNYIDLAKLNISNANAADCIIALDFDKNLIAIKNNQQENYDDSEIKNDIAEINQALAQKANINQLPTKTSELKNDSGYLTSIPNEYITESELEAKGYLTSVPSDYVTESELTNTLKNYVTDSELTNELGTKQDTLVSGTNIKTINGASILGNGDITIAGGGDVDLTNYVTKTELNNKGYLTSVPSEYVTDSELTNGLRNKQDTLVSGTNIKTINGTSILGDGDITIAGGGEVDLTNYYNKQQVNNLLNDKVTSTELNEAINSAKNQTNAYADNAVAAAKNELNNSIAQKANVNQLPTKTSQLTNDSGYLTSIPSNYVTTTDLNNAIADKANINQLPTKTSQLANDSGYLTSVPSDYITESELESKGYLTGVPSEYVTESELTNELDAKQNTLVSGVNIKTINGSSILGDGNIEISNVTGEYYTKDEIDSLIGGVENKISDINNLI